MATTIQVNVAALNRYMNRVVQPYLMRKAQEIANEARAKAPNATGELQNSITVERGDKASATVKVNAPHAGFVHQGTGPQHQPNPRAKYYPKIRGGRSLILWAMTKGLDPYKVAHGISQKGTPANPFLEESIAKVLGKFQFRWVRKDLNV